MKSEDVMMILLLALGAVTAVSLAAIGSLHDLLATGGCV